MSSSGMGRTAHNGQPLEFSNKSFFTVGDRNFSANSIAAVFPSLSMYSKFVQS